MKKSVQLFIRVSCYYLFILGFLVLFTACNNGTSKDKTTTNEVDEIVKFEEIYWNVKAIQPDGQSLDVKVFNNEGKPFDVKAIQNSDQNNLLDVEQEFEQHRKKSLEREQKLRRQLQDEVNKHRGN